MLEAAQIAHRLGEVRDRIATALQRAERPPGSCRVVLASKTQPAAAIRAAYQAGAREFGENYVQEAATKRPELTDLADITWHLIGHLQTNKVRSALANFDVIQTLDSLHLAEALDRRRSRPPVRCLIEVNLGAEASKTGIAADKVESLIESIRGKVDLAGLMTIPPHSTNPAEARRYFAQLRELRDRLAKASGLALCELSMGMTDDYEIAIGEGATIVRVGRAIFGERSG